MMGSAQGVVGSPGGFMGSPGGMMESAQGVIGSPALQGLQASWGALGLGRHRWGLPDCPHPSRHLSPTWHH
ncbi:unnamed protein product [Closterium sp. Yama58-4]|nr:unnamed protein product [Closterium sp. Yama58-4]